MHQFMHQPFVKPPSTRNPRETPSAHRRRPVYDENGGYREDSIIAFVGFGWDSALPCWVGMRVV